MAEVVNDVNNKSERASIAVELAKSDVFLSNAQSSYNKKPAITINVVQDQTAPSSVTAWLRSKTNTSKEVSLGSPYHVIYTFPFKYEQRGRWDLIIKVGDREVSSKEVVAHHYPYEIGEAICSLSGSWRLAVAGDKIYSTNVKTNEYNIVQLNPEGVGVQTFKCTGVYFVRGISVDEDGSVYVTGNHMVQKYCDDRLLKTLGTMKPGTTHHEFYDPNGIRFYQNNVYVCDSGNHRIQVLTLDLDHVRTIGINKLDHPEDLDFDTDQNMYVINSGSKSIAVFDAKGDHIRDVQLDGLHYPASIRIMKEYFYITDITDHCIVMYNRTTGQKVRSIPVKQDEYASASDHQYPVGIEVDSDGCIFVSNGAAILIY